MRYFSINHGRECLPTAACRASPRFGYVCTQQLVYIPCALVIYIMVYLVVLGDVTVGLQFLFLLKPSSIYAVFLSLSRSSRNSDPVSLSRLFFPLPPIPVQGTRLRFFRDKASALSSLVDSHRIASRLPTQLGALSSLFLLSFYSSIDSTC